MPKNHQKQTLKLLWGASKKYPWRRNLALTITATNFLVGMFVIPLVIAKFLDLVQSGQVTDGAIWSLVVIYAAAQLWSEVIGWRLVLYLVWTFETAMQRDAYQRVFEKLSSQTMFFHSNKFSGSLISQTSKLTGSIERFWDTIIWSLFPVVISIIGSVAILWFIYWPYAVFLLGLSVCFALAVYLGSKGMARLNEAEAKASNKLSGHLSDAVSNILAVKSSGAEKRELLAFSETVGTWRSKSLDTMRGFLKVSTAYSSLTAIIRIGALGFAIYAAQRDFVSVSAIYLIVTYTSSVAHNLWNMNGIMRTYNRVIGDSKEMVEILGSDTRVVDRTRKRLKVSKGMIEFSDMTYTHDEGEGDTLFSNFSLKIPKGQKVGLVGSSGSGKTTLTKLILRLADIDDGRIMIDAQDIAQVTQESLRQTIAYVPQEPLLFHRSIKENIAYGKPDATQKEIEIAAKKAEAHGFISKLSDGYDTLVGERGIKLSGGQRQRIAIARAILKDAPILILDEATSALDSESERLIQKSLSTLMKGRTSIVIAHRLSTIAKLDRVIVMDQGQIVEDGTHEDLLAKSGIYSKLWQHQSGGFIED